MTDETYTVWIKAGDCRAEAARIAQQYALENRSADIGDVTVEVYPRDAPERTHIIAVGSWWAEYLAVHGERDGWTYLWTRPAHELPKAAPRPRARRR